MHPLILKAKTDAEQEFLRRWHSLPWPTPTPSCIMRKAAVIGALMEQKLELERLKDEYRTRA